MASRSHCYVVDARNRLRDDVELTERAYELHERTLTASIELCSSRNSILAITIPRGQATTQRLGEVVKFVKVDITLLTQTQSDTGLAWYTWALVYDTAPPRGVSPAVPTWTDVFTTTDYLAYWQGDLDPRGRFIVVHNEMNFLSGKVAGGNVIPARIKRFSIDLGAYHARYATGDTSGALGNIVEGAWYIITTGDQPASSGGVGTAIDSRVNLHWTWMPADIPIQRS